jgi:hypothetical protein
MSKKHSKGKNFVEVDLTQDEAYREGTGTPWTLSTDDDEYFIPAGRVHQVDFRTVSDSDYIHAIISNVIVDKLDSASQEGGTATVDDVLSAFKQGVQSCARPRLDIDGGRPAKDAADEIAAAIELALTERKIERRRSAGRPRDGVQIKTPTSFRMEPRIQAALKELDLGPQVIADGFADLVHGYSVNDGDAVAMLEVLACLFSPAERSRPITVRLSRSSVRRWRRRQVDKIVARRKAADAVNQPTGEMSVVVPFES